MKLLRGTYHNDRNAYLVEGQPAIFHCHHYNCFLQATILDTVDYLPEVEDILRDSAQEISFNQFSSHFDEKLSIRREKENCRRLL